MKLLSVITLALAAFTANAAAPQGIDVSGYQPNINWASVKANGVQFAFIKATEGTSYTNPEFSSQYTGATNNGLIRGGYHFARPDISSGATQATFFLAHGGGWSADGITLPGALDIECEHPPFSSFDRSAESEVIADNPYGATCYGLSASAMVSWIKDFSNTYLAKTGRYPGACTSMGNCGNSF
ncbi:hypothetical protein H0H87_011924 [Tephrocybe sp. NHM501043]|nr:hypothetical protein H0H87_011924 [Tephrocybe sp. NHM501043]